MPTPKKPTVKKSKSMEKLPARKMPEGIKMPYKPSGRGGTGETLPSEISRGKTSPGNTQPSMDEKIYRTMPITEPQLKQIKKMYGI